jgi:Big-like domain-containing protein/copper-binding protein NosD
VLAILLVLFGASILGLIPDVSAAGSILPPCYVSGPISGPAAWAPSCIWTMTGNVTVMPLGALTIQPGVTVRAEPNVYLFVRGTLIADGTSSMNITFEHNRTAVANPWGGIEFETTGTGSVSWSTFSRAERAVTVFGSSPPVRNNTVLQAGVGFAFLQNSQSVVSGNTVRRAAAFGVYVNASGIQILDNVINNSAIGIQIEQPSIGTTQVSRNTITNLSSSLAAGIVVANGASVDIMSNTIRSLRGTAGGIGATPGANGRDGGFALGVYANTAGSVSVIGNTIDMVVGGNGGNGRENATGNGGRGGDGGSAAGIVVAASSSVSVQGNIVSNVAGGRGGAGGGLGGTLNGGRGGDGGEGIGLEIAFTTGSSQISLNSASRVTGGGGWTGGQGSPGGFDGSGGDGGDGYGVFLISVATPDASGNTIQTIRGGFGGNTSANLNPTGNGGRGGETTGISVVSVVGTATVHANRVDALTGGTGGRGQSGGRAGNATGVIALGNNDGQFNATSISSNTVTNLTGGLGGDGRLIGGDGGSATGIAPILVTPTLASNAVLTLQGGNGDDATAVGGRGGDAVGIIGGLVASGRSSRDRINGVTRGGSGSGGGPSYGNGYYLLGDPTGTSQFTVENGTIQSVGSYDFYVDNYTEAVALNTTFTTVAVQAAANLTVRNYLEVRAAWPNALTPVTGVLIQVADNSVTIWNRVAPSGGQSWILVTDRVYINSNTAVDNKTTVTLDYAAYTFANNPRAIPMDVSHRETFTMMDESAPTSAVSTLPAYENTLTFSLRYTANDGNGTGLGTITLWYRMAGSGSGGWTSYATQTARPEGFFAFTAAADGLYEFATTATDTSGNTQPGPNQNNTWTTVDTTRPGSRVLPLSLYETSLSFVVTWAPDGGVTDVATYTIQYNSGNGWIPWLVGTSLTSATFTAGSESVYAFRAIATDRAGNVEAAPSGNDTWTRVDVTVPRVLTSTPQGNNSSRSPIIEIAFSEPMDRASVEQAFSLTAGSSPVTGTFLWSADSTVVKFLPGAPLAAGTTFTVIVGTGASDVAGKGLQNPLAFQFTTIPSAATGLAFGDFWWLLPIVAAVLGGGLLLVMRRRAAASTKPTVTAPVPSKGSDAIIEDVFLLYHRDGILIKHETRRLRPDVDTDILTGMLTAVQQFVKDALRGDETADLDEMTVGHMHILIGRGKWLVLAARIEGDGAGTWTGQIERCIKDMEDHHWDQLEDWDGDMVLARVLMPYLKKLIQGVYTLVEA